MTTISADFRDEELTKLKVMVKKLQKQNELLRSQNPAPNFELDELSSSSAVDTLSVEPVNDKINTVSQPFIYDADREHYNNNISKLVNHQNIETQSTKQINGIFPIQEISDIPVDECWLYKPTKFQNQIIPIQKSSILWAREIFDSPSSTLSRYRRDLLNRLEAILTLSPNEAKHFSLGGSVPSLATHLDITKPISKESKCLSSFSNLSHATPSHTGHGRLYSVNTATFTRPHRQSISHISRPDNFWQPQPVLRSSETNLDPNFPNQSTSDKPGIASGSCDDLHNVADLQVMARIQQDNLKAQVAAMTAKTGSQQSLVNSLTRDSVGDPLSAPESPYSSNHKLNNSSSPIQNGVSHRQLTPGLFYPTEYQKNVFAPKEIVYDTTSVNSDLIDYNHTQKSSSPVTTMLPMRCSPESRITLNQQPIFRPTAHHQKFDSFDDRSPAVIIGRSQKINRNTPTVSSRLPICSKIGAFSHSRKFHSGNPADLEQLNNEYASQMLPSYGFAEILQHTPQLNKLYLNNEQVDDNAPRPRFGYYLPAVSSNANAVV